MLLHTLQPPAASRTPLLAVQSRRGDRPHPLPAAAWAPRPPPRGPPRRFRSGAGCS